MEYYVEIHTKYPQTNNIFNKGYMGTKEETSTDPDSVASVQHQFLLRQWKYLRDYQIFSLLTARKLRSYSYAHGMFWYNVNFIALKYW